MANLVRVSSPTAPSVSDPYGDAQRAQQYADLITARSMVPRNFGTASNAQAIQMGLTQLGEALLGRSLRGSAGAAGDQADAVQRQSNAAALEALIPGIIPGGQASRTNTLDSLGPNDAATTMTTPVAIADQATPQIGAHDALAAALSGPGMDPKVTGQALGQALLSKFTAPPEKPIVVGAGGTVFDPGSRTPLYTAPKEPAAAHLERKTRLMDNQMAQDYNFDPATGQETLVGKPYKQKAPPAANILLTGPDAALNKEADARKVAAGLAPVPSLTGRGAGAAYNAEVRRRAYELNPTLDAADFPKRAAAEKSFASSIDGRNLDVYNTIAQHVAFGEEAFKALQNGDVPRLNSIGNTLGIETQGLAPADVYRHIAVFLGNETARATIGGQSGEADRSLLSKMFSDAASPAMAAANYNAAKTLIGGRIMASRRRYQSATRIFDVDAKKWKEDTESFDAKLTPAAIDFEHIGSTAGNSAPTSVAAPTTKVINGVTYYSLGNGRWSTNQP